jgi:flagellar biosynthesis/type III secretory pathway protein FliH
MGSQQAIESAITYCIDHDIMSDILSRNRAEVIGMLLMEYDEQKTLDYLRKEALEDGIEQGLKQGLEQGIEQGIEQGLEQGLEQGIELSTLKSIRSLMESMSLSADEVMKALKLSDKEILHYKDLIRNQ